MERSKRTLWFWVLVLTAVVLPATGETRNKQLYQAKMASGSNGVGSSIITVHPSGLNYLVRSLGLPNQAVQKASLVSDTATWEVVLCENGNPYAGNCTYNASGDLEIEGPINAPMLGLAGISGGVFFDALATGHLWILLDNGDDGSGQYIRII